DGDGDGDGDGDDDGPVDVPACDEGGSGSCVRVVGRALFVDGEPFHVRGVSWNPVAVGGTHPQSLDFRGYAATDIPMMADAHINLVRTYEPILDTGVLDQLYEAGIYVINTVYPWGGAPMSVATQHVQALKNHPAILMWLVGNEWNYNQLYTSG